MTDTLERPESEEELEGIQDEDDRSLGDYPIDTLLIRTEHRAVQDVVRRIEKGSFVMNPEFQRDFIWEPDKQSKLIESVLMRIPLPVFYLAEDALGNSIVVDGLQRLSTFRNFLKQDGLKLRLPSNDQLNGKSFYDLGPKLQNRIEDCNLILYIIDVKVPDRAKLDIFERVNGGVPLTRQQMRNCLHNGVATAFLKAQSGTAVFREATGYSLQTKTMRDREFVNRFCAFNLLKLSDYKDMDDFLADALILMNGLSPAELTCLEDAFQIGLQNNLDIFGVHAFRKHFSQSQPRSVLNASLWDVMSTTLARVAPDTARSRKEEIRSVFYSLMHNDEFIKSITYSVNGALRVKHRFSAAQRAFKEFVDDLDDNS
jgi:hypothetical protein